MSALCLKLIAEITMFCDHICAALWDTAGMPWSRELYWAVRSLARVAFPIFGFQLSEGVRHSSDKRKYLMRLCVFAVLSEPFFDRALFGRWFWTGDQSVYLTLILGFFVMFLMQCADRSSGRRRVLLFLAVLPVSFLLAECADLLGTDYGAAGIWMLAVFSLNTLSLPSVRKDVRRETLFRLSVYAAGCLVLAYLTYSIELYALLGLIPLAFYTGQQGKMPRKARLLFYAAYPLHLAVLSLTVMILG